MLCFVLSLTVTSTSFADEFVKAESRDPMIEILHVPAPTIRLVHPNFGQLNCYSLAPFKALLNLDIDHQDALQDVRDLELKLQVSLEDLKDTQELATHTEAQFVLMETEKLRLAKMWKEENKSRHVAETRSVWDDWTTYALIVVGTVALTEGVIIYTTAGK